MTNSLIGTLLIAAPQMSEGLFMRSVCLVVHHDDTGAIGLMLNRPMKIELPQLWELLAEGRSPVEQIHPIHFGGPISGPVLVLHNQQALAEAQTGEGVYVAAQREHLQQLLGSPQDSVRLIVGHAGWSGGQLEHELATGIWYTLPATPELVFEADELMWSDLVRKAVGRQLTQWIGSKPIPDPTWN